MASDEFADIVVVGFGGPGAAAALSAVTRGASVVVLDRGDPPPAGLRTAAAAAGVDFRARCRVHELTVINGRVTGVGFASLRRGTVTAIGYRALDRLRRRMPSPLMSLVSRAAEAVWDARFEVGQINCAAVVLALDSQHWEFVAAAFDAAFSMRVRRGSPSSMPMPAIVGPGCGGRTRPFGSQRCSASGTEFRVDSDTRMVTDPGGVSVGGLYSAVSVDPGGSSRGAVDGWRAVDSAMRSGAWGEYANLRSIV